MNARLNQRQRPLGAGGQVSAASQSRHSHSNGVPAYKSISELLGLLPHDQNGDRSNTTSSYLAPTPFSVGNGSRREDRYEFFAPEIDDYQRGQLKLLQRNLSDMEKSQAELIDTNIKLTAKLKAKVHEHDQPHPTRLIWHNRETQTSIIALKKELAVLRSTIANAVQDLSRAIVRQKYDPMICAYDPKLSYDKVVELIGIPLAKIITGDDQKGVCLVNHLFARIILLVFMSNLCASKIEALVPNDPKVSEFCAALYRSILDSEGLAAAAKWRALVHANIKLDMVGWVEGAVANLKTILRVADWGVGDEELQLFSRALAPIFESVRAIRVAMREKTTSIQVEIFLIPFNSLFMDSYMVDVLAMPNEKAPSTRPLQCVIGNTAFGLRQLVEGEREPSGDLVYWNMVSPDVVLESSLRNILENHNSRVRSEQTARNSLMCGKD